ncbi:MAG: 50S ribosomal protein L6 [candidate division Zixibacteria bacterium]|jgi:large subunit ribosomal protein L6|nr:50S ribosomal protein L6 [candidate division Zixibacteria bacterium]
MSRVGKLPVPIPGKAKVEVSGRTVKVTGPKGVLSREIHPNVSVAVEGSEVVVTRSSDLKKDRALHGLTRALINNMIVGCTQGYTRELQIVGIGYRAEIKDKALVLYLGYSHAIALIPPDGISINVLPKENKIIVEGIDKELVGWTAAKVRSFRKPEPYKGKGIRYVDEQVRHKAGKTAG